MFPGLQITILIGYSMPTSSCTCLEVKSFFSSSFQKRHNSPDYLGWIILCVNLTGLGCPDSDVIDNTMLHLDMEGFK